MINSSLLRDRRYTIGLSQKELANLIGYSTSWVSQLEGGKKNLSEEVYQSILEALGYQEADGEKFRFWLINVIVKSGLDIWDFSEAAEVEWSILLEVITRNADACDDETLRRIEAFSGSTYKKAKGRTSSVDGYQTELVSFDVYDKSTHPDQGGVYIFYDITGRPVYIGKSQNIKRRIRDHAEKKWFLAPFVQKGAYVLIEDELLCSFVENLLIRVIGQNLVLNKQGVDRDNSRESD